MNYKIIKKIIPYIKMFALMAGLVIAIESGYWYLWMLGIMLYSAWLKRDAYIGWWGWYKSAMAYTWNKGKK